MTRKGTRNSPRLTREICNIYISLLQHAVRCGLKRGQAYSMPLDLPLGVEGAVDVERLKKIFLTLVTTTVKWRPSKGSLLITGLMSDASLKGNLATGDLVLTWHYSADLTEQMLLAAPDRNPGFTKSWASIFSELHDVQVPPEIRK